jgi:hypothetical protein
MYYSIYEKVLQFSTYYSISETRLHFSKGYVEAKRHCFGQKPNVAVKWSADLQSNPEVQGSRPGHETGYPDY